MSFRKDVVVGNTNTITIKVTPEPESSALSYAGRSIFGSGTKPQTFSKSAPKLDTSYSEDDSLALFMKKTKTKSESSLLTVPGVDQRKFSPARARPKKELELIVEDFDAEVNHKSGFNISIN